MYGFTPEISRVYANHPRNFSGMSSPKKFLGQEISRAYDNPRNFSGMWELPKKFLGCMSSPKKFLGQEISRACDNPRNFSGAWFLLKFPGIFQRNCPVNFSIDTHRESLIISIIYIYINIRFPYLYIPSTPVPGCWGVRVVFQCQPDASDEGFAEIVAEPYYMEPWWSVEGLKCISHIKKNKKINIWVKN